MTQPSRRTTVLTVQSGPDRHASVRFYRLVVGGRAERAESVRADLLVPDHDGLRTAHRHESPEASAA
ncbi:MAG: hypothetical protein ACJ72N_23070 [Labedaea sp.]